MHGIDEPGGIGRVGLDQAPGVLKAHRDGNELLLRAVVQVAFDLATGVIAALAMRAREASTSPSRTRAEMSRNATTTPRPSTRSTGAEEYETATCVPSLRRAT